MQDYDIVTAISMSKAMQQESPRYRRYSFNQAKARQLMEYFVHGPDGGAFIAEEDGHIIGMAGAITTSPLWSDDKYAVDVGVYVYPNRRGSRAGIMLIAALEKWMDAQGVKDKVLGVSTEVERERTVSLYEHLGFTLSSCSLIKPVA